MNIIFRSPLILLQKKILLIICAAVITISLSLLLSLSSFSTNGKTTSWAQTSASRAEDPGFDSRLHLGDFSRSSHTSDLKTGTPVATLPGAWHCRVSAWTGWPGVSML